MSNGFEDIFAMFQNAGNPTHTNRDLRVILDYLSTPPEEHLRRLLEKSWEMGWDAHYEQLDKQRKNPGHPITNTNPWKKKP